MMENKTCSKLDYSIHSDVVFIKNCMQCKTIFLNQEEFQEHLAQAHRPSKSYQCSQCGKAYSYNTNLVKHMRSHAFSEKNKPQCNICGKSFFKNFYLAVHMRVHTKEKPYPCCLCDRSFAHSSYLESHMTIHLGEQPHKCTDCGKSFSQKRTLKEHILTHRGIKPYVCSQCDRAFTKKSHLNRHMMIHTGAKPYQCNHCEFTFTQKQHLLRHIEVAHNSHEDIQVNVSEGTILKLSSNKTKRKYQMKKSIKNTEKLYKQIEFELETDDLVDEESDVVVTQKYDLSSEEIMLKIEEDIEERKLQNTRMSQKYI